MERLYKCLNSKKVNHSRAREVIFQVLLDSDECLSVSAIVDRVTKNYPKKISINTIYRHLNLFVECSIAVVIQDDFKRAYYALKDNGLMIFELCPRCNSVKKTEINQNFFCEKFNEVEFVTLHKRCKRCKTNLKGDHYG